MSVARHSEVQFFLAEKFLDKMNFSGFFFTGVLFFIPNENQLPQIIVGKTERGYHIN